MSDDTIGEVERTLMTNVPHSKRRKVKIKRQKHKFRLKDINRILTQNEKIRSDCQRRKINLTNLVNVNYINNCINPSSDG